MSGEAEYYYGVIVLGFCIPVAVHYLMNSIRKGLPGARRDLAKMRMATRADLEETKRLLRRR